MAKKSTKKDPPNKKVAIGKLQSDFDKFWSHKVKLNATRNERRKNIFTALKGQLKSRLSKQGVSLVKVLLQGSTLISTSIAPPKESDDYDADVLVVMKPAGNKNTNLNYLNRLYEAVRPIYKEKVTKGTRTLTVKHSKKFHIDLVPCVERNGAIYMCNAKGNFNSKTDGIGYKTWLDKKDKLVGERNLKKTIQLLKYLRDKKNNFVVKSVAVTSLLGGFVQAKDGGSDKFKDFPTSFVTLLNSLDNYLQSQKTVPNIVNPICGSESFSRDWTPSRYRSFKERIHDYNRTAQEAYRLGYIQGKYDQSLVQWQKLVGSQFGNVP